VKTALALMVILNFIMALAVAAFLMTYTIVETQGGGEFLVLKSEQGKECKDGGGCAVFSEREFQRVIQVIAMQLRGRM
jgi:hypothetical protein